ncbi:MAG: trigger factor [Oscillospiraceae bacterium]|jgi:trigger factor
MSITSNQKTAANTVELEIAVSAEELKAATDRVFHRRVKSITVPGFRKGKAPRSIIEKMYGEGIFLEEAVNDLYPKAYREAIEEANIEPVAQADIELLDVDKEKGFTFKAIVTVKPEIELGQYKGLAAEKTIYPVEEGDIEAELHRQRQRGARIITVEGRPAQNGDIAVIDFEGFTDGVPFAGGKGEGHNLELGSRSFIDGFEEQIVGHNIGDEFDVNVTFPEEYHAEELKGKPAVFKVKLHELKEKQLPELDDEFAKDVSEFDTLDELREDIRKRYTETRQQRSIDELETRLLDQIIDGVKGEIPEVMYDNKVEEMVRDFGYRLQAQGMNLDLYLQYSGMDEKSFREGFREQAERQVKMRLALETIAAKENLVPTAEEIQAEYERLAIKYGMEVDQLKGMLTEKDIASDLSCTKAIDLVRESAVVTEVMEEKVSKKDAGKEEKPKKKPAKKAASTKKAEKSAEQASEETAQEQEE